MAQVSLNDTEAERESLLRQVGELEAGLASLQPLAEERARLAEEVASLNKKNQFLFEELARERLRLESKIETLAEQGAKKIQLIEAVLGIRIWNRIRRIRMILGRIRIH